MEETNQRRKSIKKLLPHLSKSMKIKVPLLMIIVLLALLVLFKRIFLTERPGVQEVFTASTLQEIVEVSELSTFTSVYNGIAEVTNKKNPDEIDYHVSYNASIKAGIDLDKIEFRISDTEKTIEILLPEIKITDINVDISTLDFIFYNDKANQSTITEEAYKVSQEDVTNESQNQTAILDLAYDNAQNIVRALIEPLVNQYDPEYKITFVEGGSYE